MTSRWTQKQFAHKPKCSHVGMARLVTCKKSLPLYKMVSLLFIFNYKNLIIATFNYKLRLNLKYTSRKKSTGKCPENNIIIVATKCYLNARGVLIKSCWLS